MGVWNSHTSVGNILGSLIAGYWVSTCWGLSFIVPGAIVAAMGVVCFLFLIEREYVWPWGRPWEGPHFHLPGGLWDEVGVGCCLAPCVCLATLLPWPPDFLVLVQAFWCPARSWSCWISRCSLVSGVTIVGIPPSALLPLPLPSASGVVSRTLLLLGLPQRSGLGEAQPTWLPLLTPALPPQRQWTLPACLLSDKLHLEQCCKTMA